MGKGFIHVYTGNGKGKTTAALGLAFRAMGHGLKVYIAQFMKGQKYGELESAKRFNDLMRIEQFGEDTFVHIENPSPQDIENAEIGLRRVREAMEKGYDIVVADEIITAVHYRLISEEDVLNLMDEKPHDVELVLTGRYATDRIIQRADLVTEMKEVKHYFQKGVLARDGIER